MVLSYKIMHPDNQIRVVGSGNITSDDLIKIIRDIMNDPRCSPESAALIDLRAAAYIHENSEQVVDVALTLESFPGMLKNNIAIVATRSTLLAAEVIATHIRNASDVNIRVFVDLPAAEAFCFT